MVVGGADGRVRWGIPATGGIAAAFAADPVDLPDVETVAVASRSEADRGGVRYPGEA